MNKNRYPKSYEYGVEWIACNDDPLVQDIDAIAGMISTCLLADLFGREPLEVATDIYKFRVKYEVGK